MRHFTRYDKATGEIICTVSCSEDQPIAHDTDTVGFIDGHYQRKDFYIATGTPILKPPKPDELHDWNVALKAWALNAEKVAKDLIAKAELAKLKEEQDRTAANLLWLDNFIKSKEGKI